MYIGDIAGIFLLCAVIMLPLGYFLRAWLPPTRQWLRHLLFSPRYLKSEGIWQRKGPTPSDSEHDQKD
ncbi:cellulose biosynthesis protein BcsF [Zobellella maritima]|uniref:cellulose biosynthesis protein BcsF n=1 Tax=Zobellella maritima TaxID=2059725 RepID=UPI000E306D54|nr:cellulose biosynthesis protein BcsF [Zobellella maritima]